MLSKFYIAVLTLCRTKLIRVFVTNIKVMLFKNIISKYSENNSPRRNIVGKYTVNESWNKWDA